MSYSLLKGVLIFVAGGGVGGAIGSYVMKIKLEEKHKAELIDMEEYYVNRHPDKKPRENGYYEGDKQVQDDLKDYVKPAPVDYTKYYDPDEDPADNESPNDDETDNYDEGLELEKERIEDKNKKPKLIAASDFGMDPKYGTLSLLYYTENDTLTIHDDEDMGEDVIYLDEIADFIGDALDKFDFRHSDEKVIYVRNFRRSTDFEITKVYGAFGE